MPISFFDPGQMTARLDLQRPVDMPDGQGGVARSYQTVASFWAHIEPVSMAAEALAGQTRGVVTHRIWLRQRDDIFDDMRLVKGARIFQINALRDPDERGRYLVCLCQEGAL